MLHTLFAAFDVFPSAKGSTTRIAHTLRALRQCSDALTLACSGWGDMPRIQLEGGITIRRCQAMHPNFLRRAELFGAFVYDLLDAMSRPPDTLHFRDIWSGIPLLAHPRSRVAKIFFEVNGIPSIELPMHFPRLYQHPVLMSRIRAMEDECLRRADAIITVSRTNAAYLERRGAAAEKIRVIPNIADTPPDAPLDATRKDHLLYVGTLTPWQGVSTLIDAFALLADQTPLRLTLACSTKKFLPPLRRQIRKRGLRERVDIHIGLDRERLAAYYGSAFATVAPLTRCERNDAQGCSPLKILESMAAGTPVIASNLAVCRELIAHGADGWLVTPDSPRALAHGLLTLLNQPEMARALGRNARQKVARDYTPAAFAAQLRHVYRFK